MRPTELNAFQIDRDDEHFLTIHATIFVSVPARIFSNHQDSSHPPIDATRWRSRRFRFQIVGEIESFLLCPVGSEALPVRLYEFDPMYVS